MKKLFPALLLCLLAMPAAAQDADPVLRAMGDELARSTTSLRMPSYKQPYFVSYAAEQVKYMSASASFGALLDFSSQSYHSASGQVRVGSPKFDNTNYAGSGNGGSATLGLEGDYYNSRFNFWALTDDAYKASLEKLAQKRAFKEKKNITELMDDFSPAKPVVHIDESAPADIEAGKWPDIMKQVSAVFKKYPLVQKGVADMFIQSSVGRYRNSEGTMAKGPGFVAVFNINATVQATDGYKMDERRSYVYASTSDLPTGEFLTSEAEKFAGEMTALVHASSPTAYIGPVIFEGRAAGQFFSYLLGSSLTNMRPIWSERETGTGGAGEFYNRLGMRVMAPFFNVVDDPLAKTYNGVTLLGHYDIDDEGVPAQQVQVVRKGKLVDFLMGRTPAKERYYSNGHGRSNGSDAYGSPANLFVQAEKTVSPAKLKEMLLDLCREQEQEYCIIIRDVNLYSPFNAYKVDPKTGREEPLRGLEFMDIGTRSLRDIAAASDKPYVYNYFARNGGTSIIAPSILVQEVEIKRTEKKPERMPYLGHPYFSER